MLSLIHISLFQIRPQFFQLFPPLAVAAVVEVQQLVLVALKAADGDAVSYTHLDVYKRQDQMKALGLKVVLLTGDNTATARHIGATIGLDADHVIACLLYTSCPSSPR